MVRSSRMISAFSVFVYTMAIGRMLRLILDNQRTIDRRFTTQMVSTDVASGIEKQLGRSLYRLDPEIGQDVSLYQSLSGKLINKTLFPITVLNGQWALCISSAHSEGSGCMNNFRLKTVPSCRP